MSYSPMAALLRRSILIFIVLYAQVSFGIESPSIEVEEEQSTEELLLKPLADRKVLAHFHFESKAPPSNSHSHHHRLFPKAISQMVKKFRVKEMELSFTQGRWNYEQWGGFDPLASSNAKPPGVELWAVFDVPISEVDASWKNLTHALSGLFCASINFLESSTAYSAPKWSFRQASGYLRYGTLPREAVCTENLTPWLKLLPCRDKAGIASLMDRPSLYRGFYHSQRLHIATVESGFERLGSGLVLKQTLTVVLHPKSKKFISSHPRETNIQPSWSLSSIFGKEFNEKCFLAKSSSIFLHLEGNLVAELKNLKNEDEIWSNTIFELSDKPDKVLEEINNNQGKNPCILFEFEVDKYPDDEQFDLGLKWKVPMVWSSEQAPLSASRFLMGSGNERGAIAISLKSTELSEGVLHSPDFADKCTLQVNVFQVVPWYIKVYYHTLQVFVDQQLKAGGDTIEKIHVSPSKDKISPGVMEMVLKLPCSVKSAALTIEFDKGFLHIDEYPPDANQGFDIPSAVISFPDYHASLNFKGDQLNNSPLLSKFKEKTVIMSYTEVLLVPLTTPDFSMPYNVITITCTVFALYFGSLLNVLRRRVGEEERLLKSKASQKTGIQLLLSKLSSKLRRRPTESTSSSSGSSSSFINSKVVLKIIFVAGIAVCLQYFYA